MLFFFPLCKNIYLKNNKTFSVKYYHSFCEIQNILMISADICFSMTHKFQIKSKAIKSDSKLIKSDWKFSFDINKLHLKID